MVFVGTIVGLKDGAFDRKMDGFSVGSFVSNGCVGTADGTSDNMGDFVGSDDGSIVDGPVGSSVSNGCVGTTDDKGDAVGVDVGSFVFG